MMDLPLGLAGLEQALSARLALEGFELDINCQEGGVEVAVRASPWHQIMIKSGRGEFSERVSEVICRVENETWASEFSEKDGEKIDFERQARLCRWDEVCRLRFRRKKPAGSTQAER